MDKELTVLKWVLIVRPKISQMPHNLSAHFVCPRSKVLDFKEKKAWVSVVRDSIYLLSIKFKAYVPMHLKGRYLISWQLDQRVFDFVLRQCHWFHQKTIVRKFNRCKRDSNILAKGQLISKCPSGVIVWTKILAKKLNKFQL